MSVDSIIEQLKPVIPDIAVAPKGEMSIYSHVKNLRIQVSNAKDVTESIYNKFEQAAFDLKPSVAVFISCVEEIGFDVDTSPCLLFFIHISDLNERFIDYLGSLPDVNENVEEEDAHEEEEDKPAKKPVNKKAKSKDADDEQEARKPQSFIETFDSTVDGFNDYCIKVTKSKIEFKKAQSKWPKQMKAYPTLKSFAEYVCSLKSTPTPKSKKGKN